MTERQGKQPRIYTPEREEWRTQPLPESNQYSFPRNTREEAKYRYKPHVRTDDEHRLRE